MISLYVVGILLAVVMSRIFSKWVVKGEDTPFVMELPPYRFPTAKAIMRHTWEKGKQYLKKMGGIILVASIIVWALGYFPHDESLPRQEQQEQKQQNNIQEYDNNIIQNEVPEQKVQEEAGGLEKTLSGCEHL